jgi:hypothetical protein
MKLLVEHFSPVYYLQNVLMIIILKCSELLLNSNGSLKSADQVNR